MSATVKKAGFLQLAFMIYGASCGGAFGAEEMVSASGPGMALFSLILVPFAFSLPIAFAVGELTAAFPVEGGNYRWSRSAFGNFWGVQAAWWAWSTGMMTNVVFTSLFVKYLHTWFPGMSGGGDWAVSVVLIWVVHVINLRGIDMVGNASIALTLLLLMPFALMTLLGLWRWQVNPLVPFANPGAGGGLTALGASLGLSIFLYSGYDKLSAVAEEVEDPQSNFPPALTIAVTMACLSYVLPTLVGVAALGNWKEWTSGYFPTAATRLGGAGLGHAMALAGLCSNALLLNVTMLAISRIPLALAEDRYLPGLFSRHHPRFQTPVVSLTFGSIACSLFAGLSLDNVLIINSWLQMTTNLLIFANLWRLRRTHADTPRAFSFPGGRAGLAVGTLVIGTLALFAMVTSVYPGGELDTVKLGIALAGMSSGAVGYGLLVLFRGREWKDVDPRKFPREDPGRFS